jgi:glucose-1-phosphate cytidylyltransferase
MKVVLFCGGLGTRLRDYSDRIPKPLVEVGSRPILWNVMRYYAHFGHTDFILCLGYKGAEIKNYFRTYDECASNDFVFSQGGRNIELLKNDIEKWNITFVDTGLRSSIGERLRRVRQYVEHEEVFLANYSDGVSDLDCNAYIDNFLKRDKVASFLAVRVPQTFHIVDSEADGHVRKLIYATESPMRVNGGYFALRREIFDYLEEGEELVVEAFDRLIAKKQLVAVPHEGFWRNMDTFRDKAELDELVEKGRAPWQVWLP